MTLNPRTAQGTVNFPSSNFTKPNSDPIHNTPSRERANERTLLMGRPSATVHLEKFPPP